MQNITTHYLTQKFRKTFNLTLLVDHSSYRSNSFFSNKPVACVFFSSSYPHRLILENRIANQQNSSFHTFRKCKSFFL